MSLGHCRRNIVATRLVTWQHIRTILITSERRGGGWGVGGDTMSNGPLPLPPLYNFPIKTLSRGGNSLIQLKQSRQQSFVL